LMITIPSLISLSAKSPSPATLDLVITYMYNIYIYGFHHFTYDKLVIWSINQSTNQPTTTIWHNDSDNNGDINSDIINDDINSDITKVKLIKVY